jgi:hypothetical protein
VDEPSGPGKALDRKVNSTTTKEEKLKHGAYLKRKPESTRRIRGCQGEAGLKTPQVPARNRLAANTT